MYNPTAVDNWRDLPCDTPLSHSFSPLLPFLLLLLLPLPPLPPPPSAAAPCPVLLLSLSRPHLPLSNSFSSPPPLVVIRLLRLLLPFYGVLPFHLAPSLPCLASFIPPSFSPTLRALTITLPHTSTLFPPYPLPCPPTPLLRLLLSSSTSSPDSLTVTRSSMVLPTDPISFSPGRFL
ncbi:hypothetical protein B0H14DRAFT_3467875 [Mycena olivaceomarginata]|nr:hypothetical protein B0H14DRAFT_3467875 [Mycena olivaceomarginata]